MPRPGASARRRLAAIDEDHATTVEAEDKRGQMAAMEDEALFVVDGGGAGRVMAGKKRGRAAMSGEPVTIPIIPPPAVVRAGAGAAGGPAGGGGVKVYTRPPKPEPKRSKHEARRVTAAMMARDAMATQPQPSARAVANAAIAAGDTSVFDVWHTGGGGEVDDDGDGRVLVPAATRRRLAHGVAVTAHVGDAAVVHAGYSYNPSSAHHDELVLMTNARKRKAQAAKLAILRAADPGTKDEAAVTTAGNGGGNGEHTSGEGEPDADMTKAAIPTSTGTVVTAHGTTDKPVLGRAALSRRQRKHLRKKGNPKKLVAQFVNDANARVAAKLRAAQDAAQHAVLDAALASAKEGGADRKLSKRQRKAAHAAAAELSTGRPIIPGSGRVKNKGASAQVPSMVPKMKHMSGSLRGTHMAPTGAVATEHLAKMVAVGMAAPKTNRRSKRKAERFRIKRLEHPRVYEGPGALTSAVVQAAQEAAANARGSGKI